MRGEKKEEIAVYRGVARISARGGLIQHALMPLYSSLRNRTPQGTRGVGRNLLRGFPVDLACCEAAPPRIARKKNFVFHSARISRSAIISLSCSAR